MLSKKEIKEMLLTIEGDAELKDLFCNMMDSYRSNLYYHTKRQNYNIPFPKEWQREDICVVPTDKVKDIKTIVLYNENEEVSYLPSLTSWNEKYYEYINVLNCEVRKGKSFVEKYGLE